MTKKKKVAGTSIGKQPAPNEKRRILRYGDRNGALVACNKFSVSKATYYRWKAKYKKAGMRGLINRPSTPATRPNQTLPEVVNLIKETAASFPELSNEKIANRLCARGHSVSHATVGKYLREAELATKQQRFNMLEDMCDKAPDELSSRQRNFMVNFTARRQTFKGLGTSPGDTLVHTEIKISKSKRVYLAIDTRTLLTVASKVRSSRKQSMKHRIQFRHVLRKFAERFGVADRKILIDKSLPGRKAAGQLYRTIKSVSCQEVNLDSYLADFTSTMEARVKKRIEDANASTDLQMTEVVEEVIDAHNRRRWRAFPSFGRSPRWLLRIAKKERLGESATGTAGVREAMSSAVA
ncbi:MAG: helix-turn-helix domain-containing protein [Alphaproteobacteria bacterium]|nr:helix-turn-helix domain-containing protein [Alphaproteobacteria bacterium]